MKSQAGRVCLVCGVIIRNISPVIRQMLRTSSQLDILFREREKAY